MAMFQSSVNTWPLHHTAIESSVPLSITRMSPHTDVSLLRLTGEQESLHVTGVVGVVAATGLPGWLRHPRKSHLVVPVTLLAVMRLQY